MYLESQSDYCTVNLVEVKFNRNQFQCIDDCVPSLSFTEFSHKASMTMSWTGLSLRCKNHTPK